MSQLDINSFTSLDEDEHKNIEKECEDKNESEEESEEESEDEDESEEEDESEDKDESEEEDEDEEEDFSIIKRLQLEEYNVAINLIKKRLDEDDNVWINEDILNEIFLKIKNQQDTRNIETIRNCRILLNILNLTLIDGYNWLYTENLIYLFELNTLQHRNIVNKFIETIIKKNFSIMYYIIVISLQTERFKFVQFIFEVYDRLTIWQEFIDTPRKLDDGYTPNEVLKYLLDDMLDDFNIMDNMDDKEGAIELIIKWSNHHFLEEEQNEEDNSDEWCFIN